MLVHDLRAPQYLGDGLVWYLFYQKLHFCQTSERTKSQVLEVTIYKELVDTSRYALLDPSGKNMILHSFQNVKLYTFVF